MKPKFNLILRYNLNVCSIVNADWRNGKQGKFPGQKCGICDVQTSTATILFVQVLRISTAIIIQPLLSIYSFVTTAMSS